jgi:hypothetical protein
MDYSMTPQTLATALKASEQDIQTCLQSMLAAQLLKTDKTTGHLRLKKKAATQIAELFNEHGLNKKKVRNLRDDAEQAKQLRAAQKKTDKATLRAKAKKKTVDQPPLPQTPSELATKKSQQAKPRNR